MNRSERGPMQNMPWRFPVEAGHIMLFARALGDSNPIYFDEEYARISLCGGVIAPPTFLAAQLHFDPDFSMRPGPGQPWLGSGRNPSGLPDGGKGLPGVGSLHAEQHYHYCRPIRPGDVLTRTFIPGTQWGKIGSRGGRLSFSDRHIEWRDQEGDLVATERVVSVRASQVPRRKEHRNES